MAPEHRQRDDLPNLTFTHVINTSNSSFPRPSVINGDQLAM